MVREAPFGSHMRRCCHRSTTDSLGQRGDTAWAPTRMRYPSLVAISTVLFDFDFTLGDSSAGIIECVNLALEDMGLPKAAPHAIVTTIGLSLETMFVRLTGLDHPRKLEFKQRFISHADRIMTQHTHLYPWVPVLLRELKSHGHTLGIVTTKRSYRIAEVFERERLASMLDTIVGSDMVMAPKPSPEGLLRAIQNLGVPASQVLYVGDTVTDAEAANRAGISFAAVLTGPTPASAFAPLAPRAILPDARAIETVIGRFGALAC